MPERWLGIVVAGSDRVVAVDAEVPKTGPLVIQADHSCPLQKGQRAAAYSIMHQQVRNYCHEQKIAKVVVKSSAVSQSGRTTKAHLDAAELRGVVIAAAAAEVDKTELRAKGVVSRTFGERKADEYLKDDNFWKREITGGGLRSGSREAALMLLAARKNE
jgi:hypothetical protein